MKKFLSKDAVPSVFAWSRAPSAGALQRSERSTRRQKTKATQHATEPAEPDMPDDFDIKVYIILVY